ncbi:MAG: cyclodeaminase/cyclohydrolase family protein [Oscillospiraceae bacterium]
MTLKDQSLTQFTALLASKEAVPGGGGASAMAGALGAALGAMVGNLTIGKKKYAEVEYEMIELTEKAQVLSRKLLRLVDEDADAFEPLSRAYSLPKDAPGRDDILEACLRRAADTPMRILRLCCEAIELHEQFAAKGSVMAASDAATGAVLCWGAMYGAAMNVKVNTKLMKRRDYADALNREVDTLVDEYWKRAEKVYEDIYRRYC